MTQHVYHWKHGWVPLDHTAALSKAHGSHTGAQKIMAEHGIRNRQDVAKALTTLHTVPTADQPHAMAQVTSAAHRLGATDLLPGAKPARVRSLPPDAVFSGVHTEVHMGERISVRRWAGHAGYLQTTINGHHIGTPIAHTNAQAVRHLDQLKLTVEDAKAHPDHYTNGNGDASYGMKLTVKPKKAQALA